MDPSEYRRQFEDELRHAARPRSQQRRAAEADADADGAEADGDEANPAPVTAADAATDAGPPEDHIDDLLQVLLDASRTVEDRTAALVNLQELSLRMVAFPQKRPAYMEALRSLIDVDDMALRRRVIGILARAKDEYVQRRLIDGLRPGNRPLVPVAKAIQFLGYDVHDEHFPVLRGILADPPNQAAKLEAIRALSADPQSEQTLADLARDGNERPEVRRQAAAGLQSLAPDTFQAVARELAVDATVPEDLRAMALTGMALFGPPGGEGEEVSNAADQMAAEASSRHLRKAAQAFVERRDG